MSQMSFQDLSPDNQRRIRYFYDKRISINNDSDFMMANAIYEYDRDMQMGQVRDDYYGISRNNVDRLKWFNENRFKINSDEDLYHANRFYDRYNAGRLTGIKVDYREPIKIPNYGSAWQEIGYNYDPEDYDDMQRQQLNLPPGSYLKLYGNSKEDQARLVEGRAPIRFENTARLVGDVEDLRSKATAMAQNGALTRDDFDYMLSGYDSIQALDNYNEQLSVADVNNQAFGIYGLDKKEVPNLFVDHIGEMFGEGWKDRMYEEIGGTIPVEHKAIDPRETEEYKKLFSAKGIFGALADPEKGLKQIEDVYIASGKHPEGVGMLNYGFMRGFYGMIQGARSIPAAFIQDEEKRQNYLNAVNEQYQGAEMLEDIDTKQDFLYKLGNVMGSVTPGLVISVATAGAGAPVSAASWTSAGFMGASTLGSSSEEAYKELKAQGVSDGEAMWKSLAKGGIDAAVTVGLERYLGQIPKLGSAAAKAVGLIGKKSVSEAGKTIVKRVGWQAVKKALKNVAGEVIEEELEGVSQNITQNLFVDKNQKIIPEMQEILDTALYTTIVSLLLGGGEAGIEYKSLLDKNKATVMDAVGGAVTSALPELKGTQSEAMGQELFDDLSGGRKITQERVDALSAQLETDLAAVENPSYKAFKQGEIANTEAQEKSLTVPHAMTDPLNTSEAARETLINNDSMREQENVNETELPGGGGDDEGEITARLEKQPAVVRKVYHEVNEEVGMLTYQRDELMDELEAINTAIDEQLQSFSIDDEMRTILQRQSKKNKELMDKVRKSQLPEEIKESINELEYYKFKEATHKLIDIKIKCQNAFLWMKEINEKAREQHLQNRNRFNFSDKTLNQIKEHHKDRRERTKDAVDGVTQYWQNIALKEVSKAKFNELKRVITKTIPAKLSRYNQMPLQDGFREGMMTLYESIGPLTNGGLEREIDLSKLQKFVNNNKELQGSDGDTLGQLAEMFEGLDGKKLSELNDDEVELLTRMLKSMIHISNTMNKVRINGRDVETRNVIGAINKLVSKNDLKIGKRLKKPTTQELFGFGAMDPEVVVRVIFGNDTKNIAYDAIYGELNRATHEESRLNVSDYFYFNKMLEGIKGVKHWSGRYAKRVSIEVETNSGQGRTLNLTKSELIMLSLHARNEYNMAAMKKGLLFADDKSIKANGGKEAFSLSEKDIKKIVEMVNNDTDMKKVADGIFDWWNLETYTDQFGNKIPASKNRLNVGTLLLYGYKVATEENYVPLIRDKTLFQKVFTVLGSTLESYGFLKARNHTSDKPIILLDVFSQVKHHADATAKFATWAVPIKNLKRIMGHPDVRQVLNDNYGKVVENYFDDLIKKADGNSIQQNPVDVSFMKWQSQVKKAIVASPYIWINQLGSIPLAAAELKMKYFAKGINLANGKESLDKMIQYAPSLYARRFFGGDREIAEVMSEKSRARKTLDKPSATVTKFDTMAINFIWNWAAAEVRGETNLLGDAYWKAVAEKATQCVERTQPNASMMHRSKVGKTESPKLCTLLMFSTVPNKIYNMYISAALDMKTGNKKRAVKYIAAAVGSALWVALKNHIRANARKEKETNAKTFLLDFGSSLVTPIYFLNKVINMAKGRAMGLGGSPLEDVVWDMGSAVLNLTKQGASAKDFKKFAFACGQLFGIPATQWERDVVKPLLKGYSWDLYDAIYKENSYTQDYAVAIQMGRERDIKGIADIMARQGKSPSFSGSSWYEILTPKKKKLAVESYYQALANAYDEAGSIERQEKIITEMVRVATYHNKYSILPTATKTFQSNNVTYQLEDKYQDMYQRVYLALVMYGADHKDTAKLLGGKPLNTKGKAVAGYTIHGIDDLINTKQYKNATDEEQLKMIEAVKRAANEVAKAKVIKALKISKK